jgi:hypothetical protein
VRVTSGLPNAPVSGLRWSSFAVADDGIYHDNIQVAELNSLAATLAVIRWRAALRLSRFCSTS